MNNKQLQILALGTPLAMGLMLNQISHAQVQNLIRWPAQIKDSTEIALQGQPLLHLSGGHWQKESLQSKDSIYQGFLIEDPMAYVFLREDQQGVSGSIHTRGQQINLEAIGFKKSLWTSIQGITEDLPSAHQLLHPEPTRMAPPAPPASDSTSEIDVYILYSTEYKASFSSDSALDAEIKTRIAESNQIYANSQIRQKLVLLGHRLAAEIPDTLTSGSAVGTYNIATRMRDSTGADLVSFWTLNGSAGSGSNFNGYASACWSTTKKANIQGIFTFTHELGHNMGAKHDRTTYELEGRTAELGQDLYHFGMWWNTYRTVMSYSNCPGSCPRIPYFSNPQVLYQGVPTGIALGQTNPADNARKINENRAVVAAFKQRLVSPWSSASSSSSNAFSSSNSSSSTLVPVMSKDKITWNHWGFEYQGPAQNWILRNSRGQIIDQGQIQSPNTAWHSKLSQEAMWLELYQKGQRINQIFMP